MKLPKLVLFAVAIVAMSFNDAGTELTDAERKYASQLLQDTEENLLKKVKGLSPEQLKFKPSADSWSVAECVEHIAISENSLFGMAQASLQQPADPSVSKDVKMTDDNVVKAISDRTTKIKTQDAFVPTGKFGNFEATLGEFKTKRDGNIKYINTTSDDLRNHYNDFPFGKVDAYQTILFMAGHTKRHTDQIEEVMKNPGFPKKGK
ncbi:MAG TPA: DinB family protein [Cyclobacteriaceae bacterium]|nr:DinB family protein [Cyclobacteriaceae bacterium]